MTKKFELKRIDEDVWEQTPLHIQEMRRRFSFLRDEISQSNKKIEKYQNSIRKLKTEKKQLEKERTILYNKLVTFHTENLPSVSPTVQPGNNFQWSINLKIGDISRKKYLGSNKRVRKKLDEIKDFTLYSDRIYNKKDDLTESCREEIRKIIQKNLIKEMESDSLGVFKRWKKDELKMWDYLY